MRFQKTFKALSDHNRREILNLLKNGSMTAGEIGEHFPVSGATISHHLNMSVVEELLGWFSGLKGEDHNE